MTKLEEQLINQNAKLLTLIEQLTAQNKQLSEQVKLLNQKLFGRSSEKGKASKDSDENQLSLFQEEELNVLNEAEEAADSTVIEPSFEEIDSYRRKKPRRKKEDLFEGLEIEVVEYQLEDDRCHCEWCNSQLRPIGKEFVRNEVIYIPARVKRVDYYRHAYECPTCKKDGADNIVKARTPKPVISKSYASPSSVSWLLHQKFEMSIPFNRQEKEWASYGIPLSRATMANWVISVSNQWLKPLYEEMHRQILTSGTLHSDETTTQVLNEKGKKATTLSYMWLLRTGISERNPIILYRYYPSRSGKHAQDFIKDYKGYLHCDGYSGYNCITGAVRVGCWAHMRRKFVEANTCQSATGKKSQSDIGLSYCNQLFKLERDFVSLSPEERYAKRLEHTKPLLDDFWNWIEQTHVQSSSGIGKAFQYAKNQKQTLMNFLLDGNCQISNNLAETHIRPFVVGRKSWYFSTSVEGAESSGVAYSIIETAKANGLNVFKYLTYLFEELPNVPFQDDPELLRAYLPWSEKIQSLFK